MIEKITDHNLERYDSRLKEWCDRKFFEKGNYGKYETTEESDAVSFYPAPNTPLEGKVKFSFKETMPTEGVKGPDNPSTLTGVSSIKVTKCSKNLCPNVSTVDWMYDRGINAVSTADGGWKLTGTATSNVTPFLYFLTNGNLGKWPKIIYNGKTYTFSLVCNDSNIYLEIYDSNLTTNWGVPTTVAAGSHVTKTFTKGVSFICRLCVARGATVDTTAYIQIEKGSIATSFEPYEGTDYTINLEDTYYGGEINLATSVMTVTQLGIELDGTENWYNFRSLSGAPGTYRTQILIPQGKNNSDIGFVCTHYAAMRSVSDDVGGEGILIATTPVLVLFTNLTSLNALKAWLASQKANGTPVCVTWNIPNPYIVQLSPTQILSLAQTNKYTPRLNTVYTDADSVQLSYLKSPIRDEYEKTQAILSLGGNS